ncbi:CCAAT/enhancer-binding protein delta-like isoform X2 [Bombyx mandarina]|uniref:BZIP domain-containing protein n=2 Tax=Bombyx TaxID=7090 RepID=A0A8R2M7D3_BOMMO|nr:CCAAT/enhancer-binding protein delta-like isoform X2 [Bombyx mandarina]XP_037875837.1 CCAAT/enhancer-binding protein delta isoform X2 [Bombyx mori]
MESRCRVLEAECQSQHGGALAALSLLRTYDRFLIPPDVHAVVGPLLAAIPPAARCLPSYCHHLPLAPATAVLPPATESEVRRRGEKRPIPPELKDDKYFERRRRNNQAAKKSRDARRIREDQIAWRACLLEQENASLRAELAALRHEMRALRSLLAAPAAPDRDQPSSTTRH